MNVPRSALSSLRRKAALEDYLLTEFFADIDRFSNEVRILIRTNETNARVNADLCAAFEFQPYVHACVWRVFRTIQTWRRCPSKDSGRT